MHVRSFAPLGTARATRLILGTMPGRVSLLANQYYAHPRNVFWDIMQQLYGVPRELPYTRRVQALEKAGVAVWDVLAACTRNSSLDSDILSDSVVPNEFVPFLTTHPRIGAIYFNGQPACKLFERHVVPNITPRQRQIVRITLPSTSSANARYSRAQKLRFWRSELSRG